MSVGRLLSWMLCGLIVGLIARLLVPGRQNLSLLMTMVLGTVGAVVGGFLYSLIQGAPAEPFSLRKRLARLDRGDPRRCGRLLGLCVAVPPQVVAVAA
jgi:uncharacterized membrane protein YeaQ/YmgE (transglycosylase-associated protein family)